MVSELIVLGVAIALFLYTIPIIFYLHKTYQEQKELNKEFNNVIKKMMNIMDKEKEEPIEDEER